MKLSFLLAQRPTLLRQARLANLAFAHERLTGFARRIACAQLRGEVRLQPPAQGSERFWAALIALEGAQSVIEEHFTDEDIMDLTDVIAYASGENERELTFRIEELADQFLRPLRAQLEDAGVQLDLPLSASEEPGSPGREDCSHADEEG